MAWTSTVMIVRRVPDRQTLVGQTSIRRGTRGFPRVTGKSLAQQLADVLCDAGLNVAKRLVVAGRP